MSNIWREHPEPNGAERSWSPTSLDGEAAVPLLFPGDDADDAGALLLRSRAGDDEAWLLMCIDRNAIALNGEVVHGAIRVLADRDEIRVAGCGRVFFSTERLARVEPFPGADKRLDCPRCKLEIEVAQAAVRCPNPSCGRWFHQLAERPCWTYADCVCSQPTALDNGYRWSPEGL